MRLLPYKFTVDVKRGGTEAGVRHPSYYLDSAWFVQRLCENFEILHGHYREVSWSNQKTCTPQVSSMRTNNYFQEMCALSLQYEHNTSSKKVLYDDVCRVKNQFYRLRNDYEMQLSIR